MRSVVLGVFLLVSVFAATADAKRYQWAGAIYDPLVTQDDNFGRSAAIEGNLLVVGDPGDDTIAEDGGLVHVFDLDSGNLLRTIADPSPSPGKRFGYSLSIDDGVVVVGSLHSSSSCPSILSSDCVGGQVHVFDVLNGEHLHSLEDPAPDYISFDAYGIYVDIRGDNIVVSDGLSGVHYQTVHIFDAHIGEYKQTIGGRTSPRYGNGNHIAAGEPHVLVGLPWAHARGLRETGRVEVINPESETPVSILLDPEPVNGGLFGSAIAMEDRFALIGSPGIFLEPPERSGRVYLFDVPNGELIWTYDSPALPEGYELRYLGGRLALHDGIAAIGLSVLNPSGGIEDQVHLIDISSGLPLQVIEGVTPDNGVAYSRLRAFDSGILVISSRASDDLNGPGRLNIFRLVPEPASHLLCCLAFAAAVSRRPRM